MNAALLIAAIEQIGLPELKTWLASRAAAGQTVTDADVIAKLTTDTNLGEYIGNLWLKNNPIV